MAGRQSGCVSVEFHVVCVYTFVVYVRIRVGSETIDCVLYV